jgi:hypothetical protein
MRRLAGILALATMLAMPAAAQARTTRTVHPLSRVTISLSRVWNGLVDYLRPARLEGSQHDLPPGQTVGQP